MRNLQLQQNKLVHFGILQVTAMLQWNDSTPYFAKVITYTHKKFMKSSTTGVKLIKLCVYDSVTIAPSTIFQGMAKRGALALH